MYLDTPIGKGVIALTCRRKSTARWLTAEAAPPPDRAAAVDIPFGNLRPRVTRTKAPYAARSPILDLDFTEGSARSCNRPLCLLGVGYRPRPVAIKYVLRHAVGCGKIFGEQGFEPKRRARNGRFGLVFFDRKDRRTNNSRAGFPKDRIMMPTEQIRYQSGSCSLGAAFVGKRKGRFADAASSNRTRQTTWAKACTEAGALRMICDQLGMTAWVCGTNRRDLELPQYGAVLRSEHQQQIGSWPAAKGTRTAFHAQLHGHFDPQTQRTKPTRKDEKSRWCFD